MKVSSYKIKFQNLKVFITIVVVIFFKSCRENQDKLFNKLQNEFSNSIKKSKAKKFKYQYDELSPQESYFVGSKLQYLILKSSGELTDIENLIIFKNDSVNKVITRKEIYEGNSNGHEAGRNWNKVETDSIFIINYKNKTKKVYSANKFVKTIKLKNFDDELKYFYEVKKQTENNYK